MKIFGAGILAGGMFQRNGRISITLHPLPINAMRKRIRDLETKWGY